jgi:hypothetical protein
MLVLPTNPSIHFEDQIAAGNKVVSCFVVHAFYLYPSDTGILIARAPLFFALVVADLGLLSEELAEGSLLLRSSGRSPAKDAHLPSVGVDHYIRFDHRGVAEVP